MVRFPTSHFALAPIAGLQMPLPSLVLGDVALVRCNRAEWETAERSYVFKDWHGEYYNANPVFLYRAYEQPLEADETLRALDDLDRTGRRLVTALRLMKPGRLLEPAYTARFVVSDAARTRAVGPYRTEYLAMPIDGLTWDLTEADAPTLARLLEEIAAADAAPDDGALHAALDHFNLSHTPLVSSALAVHLLLTTVALVFDDDARGAANKLATTMYDRALAALQWASAGPLDPAFETFYRDEVQPLRNAVHHHALAGTSFDLDEAMMRLQWPLRIGLRLLMKLHVERAGRDAATPRRTLNAALDRFAAGDRAALDALI